MERLRIEVIDRQYAAILAAKTPAERLAMVADCFRSATMMLAAGARLRHPDWNESNVAAEVARRMSHGAI